MQLSEQAAQVISAYESLSIGGKHIRCPYFNNKKSGARAALKVLVGKGSPKEIEEEAKMIALAMRTQLDTYTEEQLRKFLVEHNLGVECSGFAYHVLDAELQSKGSSLKDVLSFPGKSFIRRLLASWRTIENTNVQVFADDANSTVVPYSSAKAGDMIIMLGTGTTHTLDHILVVTEVTDGVLHYVHALNWKQDGLYNHGIRHGYITMQKPAGGLLDQTWTESGESDAKNETLWRAQTATRLEVRRINA